MALPQLGVMVRLQGQGKTQIMTTKYVARTTNESITIGNIPMIEIFGGISGALEKYNITSEGYLVGDQEYQQLCIQAMVNGSLHYWASKGYFKITAKQRKALRKKFRGLLRQSKQLQLWAQISKDEVLLFGNLFNLMTPDYHLDKFPLWVQIMGSAGLDDPKDGDPLQRAFDAALSMRKLDEEKLDG